MRPLTALVLLVLIGTGASPVRACTSFFWDSPGGPLFAANLDLRFGEGLVFVNPRGLAKEGFRKGTSGETETWIAEYGSVTFSLTGREFAWGGMNEAGLAAATMALQVSILPEPDERVPYDPGALIQRVLDTCATVEDAVEAFSRVRLVDDGDCPSHFLLADATGECAGLEYLDRELVTYRGRDLPIPAMANATYEASVAFVKHGFVPAFNPGASVERVAAAARAMDGFDPELGVSPVDHALGILTEAVVDRKKWWKDWFDEPYTRWSMVFDLERREVHFRTVESPRVRHVALDDLDLSCTASLRMLDVNEDREGDVTPFFAPYEHEANLKLFRDFCKRWGIDVSKEDAVGLMEFFETFECEDPIAEAG